MNLTWDLKVGVSRIGKDRFQGSINDLEIRLIYVHADEMVYSKLCHIIWKNPEIYKDIVILTGGFDKLRVKYRLTCKCFTYIITKEWYIDAGVGSAAQAMEGHHYYISPFQLRKWKVSYFFESFGEA